MKSAVSYVVTVYNKADFLPDVLESVVLERAETGGEIIIIDDGSNDGSPALMEKFARDHANVTIITQENAGVAAATTRGIMTAKEPYLRLVDGDDIVVAGSTRHLISALDSTGCGFAFGQFAKGTLPSSPSPPTIRIVKDPLRRMLVRQPFVPATTLGHTAIMQQAMPLPSGFRTAQDFALGIKLAAVTRFAETTAFCCVQPEAAGLSADKALMFRDTVLLTLTLGQAQAWASRYRRLAIARNAGRARNYLRRHVEGRYRIKAGIGFLAIIAQIPFFWPYRRLMIYIANAYNPLR